MSPIDGNKNHPLARPSILMAEAAGLDYITWGEPLRSPLSAPTTAADWLDEIALAVARLPELGAIHRKRAKIIARELTRKARK